jgi:predicted NAD/FAD-binding protein
VTGHPVWKTLPGGCSRYIPALVDSPRIERVLATPVRAVHRTADGVEVHCVGRPPLTASAVVMACHGDDALALLGDPTAAERDVLGAFRTSANETVLHTDASWLPRRRAARAAWNYLTDAGAGRATVTYHLNRLQRLSAAADYCVTLNPSREIPEASVLARMTYTHPLYTRAAVAAQARWAEISGRNRIHYCGAYWFYGFHEDGVRSAVRVAGALGVTW